MECEMIGKYFGYFHPRHATHPPGIALPRTVWVRLNRLCTGLTGVARRLKSKHPFVPTAQHLISSSDNNTIRGAQWVDHQWNAEWTDNPTRLRIFIPDTGTPPNDPPKKSLGLAWSPPHRCWTFLLLLVQMGHGLCCLWVWRRRTNRQPCCPPIFNLSTSPWTTWPDGSGRWDNWMAAQHLPRDLVRPSSGLNN